MPTKLMAHHGQQLVGKRLWVLRTKPGMESSAERRQGNAVFDTFDRCPTPFARIGDVRLDPIERRIFRKGIDGQIEQPRPNHAAGLPNFRDLQQVESKLRLVPEQIEALRVGLHDSVFDSVVDHLHVMSRAARTDSSPPLVRPQR